MTAHLDRLVQAIYDHWAWLSAEDRLARRRAARAAAWLELAVRERWGREGLRTFRAIGMDETATPFRRIAHALQTRGATP